MKGIILKKMEIFLQKAFGKINKIENIKNMFLKLFIRLVKSRRRFI